MAMLLSSVDLSNAQLQRIPRIGVLVNGTPASAKSTIDEFREGLHDLGYIEGKNVSIDYRYAEGVLEKLSDLARDLVQSKVDVIWSLATPGTVAAKKVTNSIPIVFTGVGDPVASGLVKSFAKAGRQRYGRVYSLPRIGGQETRTFERDRSRSKSNSSSLEFVRQHNRRIKVDTGCRRYSARTDSLFRSAQPERVYQCIRDDYAKARRGDHYESESSYRYYT